MYKYNSANVAGPRRQEVSYCGRDGGETPGKTQAKAACCFCFAQLQGFTSLVVWI